MISLFAHFDGERYRVQKSDRLFIIPVFLIRIPAAADGNVVHFRNCDDRRFLLGHIELFIFLLEIESHSSPSCH